MRYDRLGFPIPPEFEPLPDAAVGRGPARRAASGRGKRLLLGGLLVGVILPVLLAPLALPVAREIVVDWSIARAVSHEGRGHSGAAIADVDRAVRWAGDDSRHAAALLCWLASLRINAGDPQGALADADRAAALAPTSTEPLQVRALAHVMLANPDAALADAAAVVDLAGPANPAALNHRAYMRALVGRDLPEALVDIEAALAGGGEASPELLDTRGFILHLLGRHAESMDQMNLAIAGAERRRRELDSLAGRADPDALALRRRTMEQSLAVMHHHRGLACRAAGLERQAEQDLAIAAQKGFDPARGVF